MAEQKNRISRSGKICILIGGIAAVLCVVALCMTMTADSRQRELDSLLKEGGRYLEDLKYEQAVAAYRAALAIDPKCVEAYIGLADAYVGLKDLDMALEVLGEGYALTAAAGISAKIEEITALQAASAGDDPSGTQMEPAEGDPSGTQVAEPSGGSPSVAQEKQLVRVELDLSEYESYGLAYNGVMLVRKGGLLGAVNYQNEVVVPCEYSWGYIDDQGNMVMMRWQDGKDGSGNPFSEGKVFALYDSGGNVLCRGGEPESSIKVKVQDVAVSGGMYIVNALSIGEPDIRTGTTDDGLIITTQEAAPIDRTISYYRLDGTLIYTENAIAGDFNIPLCGFYDGVSTIYRPGHRAGYDTDSSMFSGTCQVGEIDRQGNVTWHEDPACVPYHKEEADERHYPLNAANHGYYVAESALTGQSVLVGENYQRQWKLGFRAGWGGNIVMRGFNHDGKGYYNYGPNMVWTVTGQDGNGNRDVLVDVTLDPNFTGFSASDWTELVESGYDVEHSTAKGMVKAVYGYIGMSDENYWLVQKGDKWGYIDHDGREAAMYEDASAFYGGYALVLEEGTACMINEKFEKVQELGAADGVALVGTLFWVNKDGTVTLYQLQ